MSSPPYGPGAIAPDGCPVEVYALLEPGPDPAIIAAVVPPGATVLELGAGAGRLTTPLAAAGYRVTAVDESAAMLARITAPGAVRVTAAIEELALGRRFDAVLLLSHLVNSADDGQRAAFLRCCARHLAARGVVVGQRHPPQWCAEATESEGSLGPVRVRLRKLSRPGPNHLAATVVYEHAGRRWAQCFTARCLDDAELAAELAAAGLELEDWLDADRAWFTAGRRR